MGYRSEVTILTSGETDKLEAFKQAMLLRYRNKNTLDLVLIAVQKQKHA
jgi:hypothetical protein